MRVQLAALASCLLLTLQVSACAGAGGETACALAFEFEGRTFYPHQASSSVEVGTSLGEASYVSCDDGGGGGEDGSEEAFSIPGVEPNVAFAVPAAGKRLVFVGGSPDARFPIEVRRALRR